MNPQTDRKYVALEFSTTLAILTACSGNIPSLQELNKCVDEGESIIDREQQTGEPLIDHENDLGPYYELGR